MSQNTDTENPFDNDDGFESTETGGFSDDALDDGFTNASDDDSDGAGFADDDVDTSGFVDSVAEIDEAAEQQQSQPQQAAQKSFLKTPFGIAVAGIATAAVVGVGVAAFRLTQGGDEVDINAAVLPANPTGEVAAGEVDFGGAREPVVAADAKEVLHEAQPQTAAQILNLAKPASQSSPQATLESQAHSATPTPTPTPVSAPALEVAVSPEFLAEQDELKKQLQEQKATSEELSKTVATLNQSLSRLSTMVEKGRESEILLTEQVKAISDQLESSKAPAAPIVAAESSKAQTEPVKAVVQNANPNPKASGRARIPGLHVVDSTSSGKMVVVKKVSNGRVFTMFQGELINTPKGQFRVNEVLEEGSLLLVGDIYYIDRIAEDYAEVRRAAKPQPEPKKVLETKREAPAKAPEPKAAKISVLKNYTLNAVYGGGKSFGVVTNTGDFKTLKVGDSVQGIGTVQGLDANGNLKVGNSIIESVY